MHVWRYAFRVCPFDLQKAADAYVYTVTFMHADGLVGFSDLFRWRRQSIRWVLGFSWFIFAKMFCLLVLFYWILTIDELHIFLVSCNNSSLICMVLKGIEKQNKSWLRGPWSNILPLIWYHILTALYLRLIYHSVDWKGNLNCSYLFNCRHVLFIYVSTLNLYRIEIQILFAWNLGALLKL